MSKKNCLLPSSLKQKCQLNSDLNCQVPDISKQQKNCQLIKYNVLCQTILDESCDKLKDTPNLDDPSQSISQLACQICKTPDVKANTIGGKTDSFGCSISGGYSWCPSKQKCIRPWEENCPTNLPGSDRDIHGCISSAGYSWCPSKQKCIRPWEENCPTIELIDQPQSLLLK